MHFRNRGILGGRCRLRTSSGTLHTSGEFPGFEPVYRGRDGLRAFWDLWRAPWSDFHTDIARIQDVGGRYLALLTIRAVGRESGAEVELK